MPPVLRLTASTDGIVSQEIHSTVPAAPMLTKQGAHSRDRKLVSKKASGSRHNIKTPMKQQ